MQEQTQLVQSAWVINGKRAINVNWLILAYRELQVTQVVVKLQLVVKLEQQVKMHLHTWKNMQLLWEEQLVKEV